MARLLVFIISLGFRILKAISRFGCPRIAQEINKAFGVAIDKDVVRRVLAKHRFLHEVNATLAALQPARNFCRASA